MTLIESKMEFAERNHAILLSLEAQIVAHYQKRPRLHDHNVIRVLEALIKHFRALATNFPLPQHSLSEFEGEIYLSIQYNLEKTEALTPNDSCVLLKFLKKSVELNNKRSGSQGYLNFISRFIEVEIED